MPGRHSFVFCLLMMAQPVTAEVYTWTDEQGVAHFSDNPHGAESSEPVTLGTSSIIPMADSVRQSEKVRVIRQQVRKSLERKESRVPTGAADDISATEKQCNKLKLRLRKIQQRLRTGYSNDRGNRLRRQRRELSQRYARECVLG